MAKIRNKKIKSFFKKSRLSKLPGFRFFTKLSRAKASPLIEQPLILKDCLAVYFIVFVCASLVFQEPQREVVPRLEALTHPIVSLNFSYPENLEFISLPTSSLLDVGPIALPSIPSGSSSLTNTAAAGNSNAAQAISNTFSNTFQNIKRAITNQFENATPNTNNPSTQSTQTVSNPRPGIAPSFAQPVRPLESFTGNLSASLKSEIDAYIKTQGNVIVESFRSSLTRQSDADAGRRSATVVALTQSGDSAATFASLSGAGLATCQSNNVLTWANGQFGCETDDTGAGSSSAASHFATSTNGIAIYPNAATALVIGASATTTTGAELEVQGDLYVSASTTLQRLTFITATGTAATTTNLFSTIASSTNLFSTTFSLGSGTIGSITGLTSLANILATGSSTLQNFTFINATGTSATTTNWFSTVASSTGLFATSFNFGSGVFANSTSTNATTTNIFGTNASSTNLFATAFNFGNGIFARATGTAATTTNWFSTVASSTGLFSTSFSLGSGTIGSLTGLTSLANILATGSSTLQNFTFINATGTSATTTNFFATTASSTSLFASAATFSSLLLNNNSSTTLQRFTFITATGTSATTTNLFATTASSTDLFAGGSVTFAGLAATTTAGSSVCFGNAVGARGLLTQTNGTTGCGTLSSRRFKFDINSLGTESGLAEVMALRPVSYRYTPEYLGGFVGDPNWDRVFIGFVAEEIAEVDERLVDRDNLGLPRAVQYDKMVAILAKAVQEQQAIIEEIQESADESSNALLGIADGNDLSSVPSSAYFAAVWQGVANKLADAANNVEAVIANRLKAREEICINDTCINEDQLKAILSQYGAPPTPPAPPSPPSPDPVLGCMDSLATNYNADATQDDGSCEYPPPPDEPDEGGEPSP